MKERERWPEKGAHIVELGDSVRHHLQDVRDAHLGGEHGVIARRSDASEEQARSDLVVRSEVVYRNRGLEREELGVVLGRSGEDAFDERQLVVCGAGVAWRLFLVLSSLRIRLCHCFC